MYNTGICFILNFFGISLQPRQTSYFTLARYVKSMIALPSFFVHISFIYSMSVLTNNTLQITRKHLINEVICFSLSLVIWYDIKFNARKLNIFFQIVKRIPSNLQRHSKKKLCIINMTVYASFTFSTLLSAFLMVAVNFEDGQGLYTSFFFMGHKPFPFWLRQILLFIAMNLYFSSKFLLVPILVTLHGVISCTLANALRLQNVNLVKNVFSRKFREEIKTYQTIVSCCKQFDNSFGTIVFLLLAIKFTVVYNGLGMALGHTNAIPTAVNIVESAMTLSLCLVCLVCLVAFASGIPEAMLATSNIFQEIHRNALLETDNLDERMFKKMLLLKLLSETRPIRLTACGMLSLTRSFILSCFGCAFSFCILIMQLKNMA